jgi:hypothetical protein
MRRAEDCEGKWSLTSSEKTFSHKWDYSCSIKSSHFFPLTFCFTFSGRAVHILAIISVLQNHNNPNNRNKMKGGRSTLSEKINARIDFVTNDDAKGSDDNVD